jgi:uncharacterized SAM-binding protein YcdF (DUF218 family)
VRRKSRIFLPVVLVIAAAALLIVFRNSILWSLGAALERNEAPRKAQMVVVIGGDYRGNRILKAAELVHEGYAPKVLVSGVEGMYGAHESDLEIDYAVRRGFPREEFVAFHYPALNTVDEARADIGELRRLGVHSYLLVTSGYHTARARRIFAREGKDLEVHSISAPALYWQNGEWWKNREGRKLWFNEMVKTIADFFRI